MKRTKGSILSTKTCDECGKSFIPGAEHLYTMTKHKQGKKWYCSYTCWRKNGGDNSGERLRWLNEVHC